MQHSGSTDGAEKLAAQCLHDYVSAMFGVEEDEPVPTLNLPITTRDALKWLDTRHICPPNQAFELLLLSLYWLRRPLGDKASQLMWRLAERMKDDYEAHGWQGSLSHKGVVSEARST
ncbi:MAG: hypothetical protein R3183_04950 [Oleiphilaceae bacterium]|nr:hypothetical protein [Oleiphilaceae bacterium]